MIGTVIAALVAEFVPAAFLVAALALIFRKRAVLAYATLVLAFATILGIALGGLLAAPSASLHKGIG